MERSCLKFDGLGYDNISSSAKMENFVFFLENECRSDFFRDFFVKWALDPNQDITSGNINQLIKYKNEVYISDFDDEFAYDEEDNRLPTGVDYEYQISIENFVKALNEWSEITKLRPRPEEIIITQDDQGHITFQVKFSKY